MPKFNLWTLRIEIVVSIIIFFVNPAASSSVLLSRVIVLKRLYNFEKKNLFSSLR